tara:strand:- start:596 stop:1936 length:1341 start_codon:yes stop_codon:yes gene_type:complete
MTSNQHLEIVPSNITSTGKLSYKGGQPTIQILIGAQDRNIVPGSIRLCGEFTVMKNDTVIPVESDDIRMNERLGVYSMIDTLSIFSQSSGQTIETINHHNRMMSSYLSVTQSQQDFAAQSYEQALRFPNYKAQQLGVVTNTQGASASSGDSPNSFCIPLVCGLFLGQDPIPLSSQWGVGGLIIEIQLAPDQQVLFSGDNTDTKLLDSYYELSNVKLICEVQRPAGEDLARIEKQTTNTFTYNSISSYYNTINSANAMLNFNLGLKSVLSAFMNVVPASHINNFKRDGLATLEFTNTTGVNAEIEQLVFTRAGAREPLEYNIDTLQRTVAGRANENADSQIVRNYMNAVMSFAKIKRTSVEPSVFRNIDYSSDSTFSGAKTIVNGGAAFGVGVAYDSISDQGVDFSQSAFGVQLQLRLTTDHPNAIYLFVHSRQTVVSSGGSIQVLK